MIDPTKCKFREFTSLELHFAQILFGASNESYQTVIKNVFDRELEQDEIEHGVSYQDILFHDRYTGTFSAVYPNIISQ